MSNYTKGALTTGRYGQIQTEGGEGFLLCGVRTPMVAGPANDEAKANQRRLVACWNYCEGRATEYLEDVVVRRKEMGEL